MADRKTGMKKIWMGACMTMALGVMAAFPAMADTGAGTQTAPEEAGWSKVSAYTASWDKVASADGYQLRIYRDETYLKTIQVTKNKANLSEYVTEDGTYYYEVRAILDTEKTQTDAKYGEYTLSEDLCVNDLGDTDGRWRHYVDGKKYQKEDETYVENGWYRISGKWYYFDENGFAVKGWRLVGSTWYYMDSECVMQTGWIQTDGSWYYLNGDGAMLTGWQQVNPGEWYYFNPDGSMAEN